MRSAFFRLLLSIVFLASCVSLAESAQEHSGAAAGERHAIFDIGTVPTGDPDSLLGREVVAVDVRVDKVLEGGFWVTSTDGEPRTFVVPAEGSLITVHAGEMVSLHGEVRLTRKPGTQQQIANDKLESFMPYVYAYTVRPARPNPKRPELKNRT